jgi:hypothetical protein
MPEEQALARHKKEKKPKNARDAVQSPLCTPLLMGLRGEKYQVISHSLCIALVDRAGLAVHNGLPNDQTIGDVIAATMTNTKSAA